MWHISLSKLHTMLRNRPGLGLFLENKTHLPVALKLPFLNVASLLFYTQSSMHEIIAPVLSLYVNISHFLFFPVQDKGLYLIFINILNL